MHKRNPKSLIHLFYEIWLTYLGLVTGDYHSKARRRPFHNQSWWTLNTSCPEGSSIRNWLWVKRMTFIPVQTFHLSKNNFNHFLLGLWLNGSLTVPTMHLDKSCWLLPSVSGLTLTTLSTTIVRNSIIFSHCVSFFFFFWDKVIV